MRPAVAWTGDAIEIIDQTLLPAEVRILRLTTTDEVVDAIQRLAVRGAPALGVTGALGVLLARGDAGRERIASARPTAVNLRWAVERVLAADDRKAEALAILAEDVAACRAIGEHGRAELAGAERILTVCNAGRLATAGIGHGAGRRLRQGRGGRARRGVRVRDAPAAAGRAADRVGAGRRRHPRDGAARRRRAGAARRGGSTPSSPAATGSPPTATSRTRSAPTRWRSPRATTACRSTSPAPARRSTRTRPPVPNRDRAARRRRGPRRRRSRRVDRGLEPCLRRDPGGADHGPDHRRGRPARAVRSGHRRSARVRAAVYLGDGEVRIEDRRRRSRARARCWSRCARAGSAAGT